MITKKKHIKDWSNYIDEYSNYVYDEIFSPYHQWNKEKYHKLILVKERIVPKNDHPHEVEDNQISLEYVNLNSDTEQYSPLILKNTEFQKIGKMTDKKTQQYVYDKEGIKSLRTLSKYTTIHEDIEYLLDSNDLGLL